MREACARATQQYFPDTHAGTLQAVVARGQKGVGAAGPRADSYLVAPLRRVKCLSDMLCVPGELLESGRACISVILRDIRTAYWTLTHMARLRAGRKRPWRM